MTDADAQAIFETIENQLKYRQKDQANYPSAETPFDQELLDWLDLNVRWAEEHEVYLILDMHVPLGADWLNQSAERKPLNDYRIWTDPVIQERYIQLWTTIAEKYKDNRWIAAYGLLNEPVTIGNTGEAWTGRYKNETSGDVILSAERGLAERLIEEIRKIDTNHLIVLDALAGTNGSYDISNKAVPQFTVEDDNILYDVHFYDPAEYTHQYAYWVEYANADGGKYPAEDRIIPNPEKNIWDDEMGLNWENFTSVDNGSWKELSDSFTADGHKIALPMLLCKAPSGTTLGNIWFDNLKIVGRKDGAEDEVILLDSIDISTLGNWNGFSETHTHSENDQVAKDPTYISPLKFERNITAGCGDSISLSIENREPFSKDFISSWSNFWETFFEVKEGYTYTLTAQVKGEDVPSDVEVGAQLYFFKDNLRSQGDSYFSTFTKDYLELKVKEALEFGEANRIPVSCSEFGTIKFSIEREGVDYGGVNYLNDMIDLFDNKFNISWVYWNYGDSDMGLYNCPAETTPTTVVNHKNEPLISMFRHIFDTEQPVSVKSGTAGGKKMSLKQTGSELRLQWATPDNVEITIYNGHGRLVKTTQINNGVSSAVSTEKLASGIYFLKAAGTAFVEHHKVLVF